MSPLIHLIRPRQWTKNGLVFAPLIFSQNFTHWPFVLRAFVAFVGFCFISSAVYVLNDLCDIERDRAHPEKRRRPLPSGQVSVRAAVLLLLACFAVGSALALAVNIETAAVMWSYAGLVALYSVFFKNVVVLDILILAAGFVLRATAGACAIRVEVSPWLFVCTILLASFLALGKRRQEIVMLEEAAGEHRAILSEYTPYLLDQMIAIIASATIMAYSLYTMSKGMKAKMNMIGHSFGPIDPQYMMGLTVPYVLYGMLRYLYLIHRKDLGGSPERVLFADRPLLLAVVLWVGTSLLLLRLASVGGVASP